MAGVGIRWNMIPTAVTTAVTRAEFRGPGPANRVQTAIFGDSARICKTRIQQHKAAAAEFGTFLLKTAMSGMEIRNRPPENSHGP
jgi:hypothetical protein